jgi:hypothetical protein
MREHQPAIPKSERSQRGRECEDDVEVVDVEAPCAGRSTGLARGSGTSGSDDCDTNGTQLGRSRTASTRRGGRPGRASDRRRSHATLAVARETAPAAGAPPPRAHARSSPRRARAEVGWGCSSRRAPGAPRFPTPRMGPTTARRAGS